MRIPPNGGNFPTLGICCEEENNCYYFAPDAGAPCRDGSRRSPSTSTPRSSPQMLQVVSAEPPRVPTFPMRGGGGEGLLPGGFFHPRVSPPRSFSTSSRQSPTPSSPQAFWGAFKSPRPCGAPSSGLFRGAPAPRYFARGRGGLDLGCSGAQPCAVLSEGSLALPGWPPPNVVPSSPPGRAALGVQPHGRGTPKPPFGGGHGGGGGGRNCERSLQG